MNSRIVIGIVILLSMVSGVAAYVDLGDCRFADAQAVQVQFTNGSFPVEGTIVYGTIPGCLINNVTAPATVTVAYTQPQNITFGPPLPGQVVITDTSVFVDSVVRPDLDAPAHLSFNNQRFATKPTLLRNGAVCNPPECANESYTGTKFDVDVQGFSNYSLTGSKDFILQSDPQPELKDKVYQTIDLGDSYRADEFSCIVQIYGKSSEITNEWVLIQTNPQRQVQARLFGSPDLNQPESLGYFPVKNGVANVYYDGGSLGAYYDLEYVASCQSNVTKLNYEEAISTRYSPLGRTSVGRAVWLTRDNNWGFVILYIVIGAIVLLLAIKFLKIVFPRMR
jgi:hypothetical protein